MCLDILPITPAWSILSNRETARSLKGNFLPVSSVENAALTTQGGLWKTALKEQVTQYLEKRIMLSDVFYDRGALDSAQLGGSNISLNSPCLVKSCRLLRDF
jgi:hypothetical protein